MDTDTWCYFIDDRMKMISGWENENIDEFVNELSFIMHKDKDDIVSFPPNNLLFDKIDKYDLERAILFKFSYDDEDKMFSCINDDLCLSAYGRNYKEMVKSILDEFECHAIAFYDYPIETLSDKYIELKKVLPDYVNLRVIYDDMNNKRMDLIKKLEIIQNTYDDGFDLFFVKKIDVDEIMNGENKNYYLKSVESIYRHSIMLCIKDNITFNDIRLIIDEDRRWCKFIPSINTPIEVLIRFAKQYGGAYVYFYGTELFSGLTIWDIENKLKRELKNDELKKVVNLLGESVWDDDIVEILKS